MNATSFLSPVKIILLFVMLHMLATSAQEETATNDSMEIISQEQRVEFSKSLSKFAGDIYSQLIKLKEGKNIVFSPFSIQICIAMVRVGAEGLTAAELDRGLGLISNDVNVMADTFYYVLHAYEKSNILKIANKVYVMQGYKILDEFNEITSKKFFSTAEEIDFSQNTEAAKTMNFWVESKTNNLIKDLISPSSLSTETRLVLLNAIYFKGEWRYKFKKENTQTDDFYLNESDTVKVPMMKLKERFRYADLPELDAAVLEMPYKNSDLSMLIILPNSRTGLKDLEAKLKSIPLEDITKNMTATSVIVRLPRFKAEFSIELNEPLMELGMARMFSSDAEFGKMLKSDDAVQVSKIIHKAFIEVNEEGTEAAAATGLLVDGIDFTKRVLFNANRKFYFVIKNHWTDVFFQGRFISPDKKIKDKKNITLDLHKVKLKREQIIK